MDGVYVVTDSTANLPPETAERLGIAVVPIVVRIGDKSYRDGVDITAAAVYERMGEEGVPVKTSQPSPHDFVAVYERIIERAGGARPTILSLHLSSRFSGTLQAATVAKQLVADRAEVVVVDTKLTEYPMGYIVQRVAAAARDGASADECIALVDRLRANTHVFFLVDTLEYLQKGGRIGRAAALVGSLLQIKPLLTLEDGEIGVADKVRGKKKALDRLFALLAERVGDRPVHAGVLHAAVPDEAAALRERVQATFRVEGSVDVAEIGPVVGAHVGLGTLAVSLVTV